MAVYRFKPTLSAKIFSTKKGETEKNLGLIQFPVEASIKYDGFRLVEYGRRMVTRSLLPLKNIWFNQQMEAFIKRAEELGYRGMDGEVVVGAPNDPNSMQATMALTAYHGQPEFCFYLFDSYQYADKPFNERFEGVRQLHKALSAEFPWLRLVKQTTIHNMEDLLAYEAEIVAQGYEGIMLRKGSAHYKMGRSTMLQGILMALKRFVDDEALILEMWPELENANAATEDELGHTKRSSHQENLIPKEQMGRFLAISLKFDKPFGLGGGRGITHEWRKAVWANPSTRFWAINKYTYQEIGVKDRPRLPKLGEWRAWEDLDPEVRKRFVELGLKHVCSENGVCMVPPEQAPVVS